MTNVMLVVDQYQRYQEAIHRKQQLNPIQDAVGLSQLIKPFGHQSHRIAIVAEEDQDGIMAYHQSGFEILAVNGNRPTELAEFINQMKHSLQTFAPDHLVVVTTDPKFSLLCDFAVERVQNLAIWAPAETVPPNLLKPTYNYRPLEELLSDTQQSEVDVFLDYENIHIGIKKQLNIAPKPETIINAIRSEIQALGKVVSFTAYADWSLLSKHNNNFDIQRSLAVQGIETRYQVSMHGKNSADMKIADEIRNLIERRSQKPGVSHIIALITGDRDFRPVVESIRKHGERSAIITLKRCLSADLGNLADEVRYLDSYFASQKTQFSRKDFQDIRVGTLAKTAVTVMRILRQNNWNWIKMERLADELGPGGPKYLQEAIKQDLITEYNSSNYKNIHNAQKRMLKPNYKHPLIQIADHLLKWLPPLITYSLHKKGMPYVDSNYLVNGMKMNPKCRRLGIGYSQKNARDWLDILSDTRVVIKKTQLHPIVTNKRIQRGGQLEISHNNISPAIYKKNDICHP